MPHLASRAIDAKPLSSCDTLRNNFSHWNVNYLKPSYFFSTTFEHSLSSRAKSLHQLRLAAVIVSSCVFERARDTVSLLCRILYTVRTKPFPMSYFFLCVVEHVLVLQNKTCTNMCEQRAAMLGLLFAFSSPIIRPSIREDKRLLLKEAMGVF